MNSINSRRKKRKKLTVDMALVKPETGEAVSSQTEIITSEEQIEARMIVDDLTRTYKRTLEFYRQHCELSAEEARRHSDGHEDDLERYRECPVREINWHNLGSVAEIDMSEALKMWERVRVAAVQDFESGNYLEEVVGHGSPLEKSRLLHIRDSFREGWQPRNGIEQVMIDMLVETFILFQYWMAIAHSRAVHNHDRQEKEVKRFEDANWKSPFQGEANAIDQAHRLADSYNRMFLRTLRQLRDLRRYTVVIQNPNQVNIGDQQINVSKT